jgi:cytoskeletal protein CcmA (bactofilin family)
MNKTKLLLVGLLVALPLVGWAAMVHAEGFRSGNDVTVAPGETVDKTLYAAGRTIDIAGTVQGDLICAGQSVSVTGSVMGDVICAAQDIHISGTVMGDVRVAGQSVNLDGTIQGNLSAAGQDVTVDSGGKIARDASVAGQSMVINGMVGRDLMAGSQNVTINGTVGRNVQSANQSLSLGNGAHVGGDITYTSTNLLARDSGATVSGRITRQAPPKQERSAVRLGAFVRGSVAFAFYLFAALLVTTLVLVLLVPRTFQTATETAMSHPWLTLLTGFIASMVVPVAVIVLMITVIGIPLAILLLLAWFVVLFLAAPFAAYYLGRLLLGRTENNALLIMLLGASVLLVCYFIPSIGALVSLAVLWFGTGIIVLQVRRLPKPRYMSIEPARHG